MGPKQKPKLKHKQPVVYEEDYVPIKTYLFIALPEVDFFVFLTKYCLDAKIVKTLGDGDIWNNLLTTNNIRNNKKLLAGIKALRLYQRLIMTKSVKLLTI
ncbi:hypothetical protein F2Q68_00032259 [Brassica cretica]|uniref:Uncharacterized protein n=2 Tax=Brassica cretica TaxID=69181 RepID=A0A8S9G3P2_BRACR|nr:hypothetical protein F2Q68_00032259 [Brassica cretica]KAF3530682.1 hypothetical protein DY000_02042272 [Brassica cretica]